MTRAVLCIDPPAFWKIPKLGRFTLRQLLKLPGVRDVRSSLVLETLKTVPHLPLDAAAGRH